MNQDASGRRKLQPMAVPGNARSVIVASSDASVRARLNASLTAMRWKVAEAAGGAEALQHLEAEPAAVLLLDSWLPDLEVKEFARTLHLLYPNVDVLHMHGNGLAGDARNPHRHELLHALRESQQQSYLELQSDSGFPDSSFDGDVSASAPLAVPSPRLAAQRRSDRSVAGPLTHRMEGEDGEKTLIKIPEMVGDSPGMLELARLIRLVAPRNSTVLIEGETGSGKEIVAQAVHRLSARAKKPIVVLNCAAIPEALLEAELFGHARGAFTGAVNARKGRIEAADGGTLFLDEIGEMPLALQAKMLRFLECGELQRVGDNDIVQVDVRVIAATHQLLEEKATDGRFRLDLYHRLAVFPVEVPPLRQRKEDIPLLTEHFLAQLGAGSPRKRISTAALERLMSHHWPGNVRELAHVLERATILAGDTPVLGLEHIRLSGSARHTKSQSA